MNNRELKTPGALSVVLAFLTVYIVWGSTYFFYRQGADWISAIYFRRFSFYCRRINYDGMDRLEKNKIVGLGYDEVCRRKRLFDTLSRKRHSHFCGTICGQCLGRNYHFRSATLVCTL